jgi:UDP-glucose 4-epimerase
MTQGGASDAAGRIVRNAGGPRAGGRIVALTGARTFLGKNLLGLLEEDDATSGLIVIDEEPPLQAGTKTRSYVVDRTQPNASARIAEILTAERVNTFVHLGFLSTPTRQTAWAHELESLGTLHVLNACREQPVEQFVLGSSTLLYGPHFDNPNFLSEAHPLRGLSDCPFLTDKIDAERQVAAYARENPKARVAVLRFAPLLGPTVTSFVSSWLSRRIVPTLMGFDPLMQFVHEVDALAALKLALDREASGTYNITAEGVLPVSTVIKLAGRSSLPVPHFLLRRITSILWHAGLAEVPAPMLRFLKHLCVADGERARVELGFSPGYTTREAVLEFGATLRLREARLLTEAYA